MNKKSKLFHNPPENTQANIPPTAFSLTQQGYTKKRMWLWKKEKLSF
ncbi:hypothetical protein PVK73_22135 [Bacillus thuringiensis]